MAARFDHRTSRAQEPHRHSHVIVANAARGPDGKWRALDGRLLLEEHRLAAGYLYEAVVRQAASAQGFRWGPVDKGMAELEGVPRELLRRLSTRREQIEEHMAAQGTRDFRGAQTAALLTRERKPRQGLDLVARRAEWRAIAAEHGLGREEVRALGRRALEVAFGRALGTAAPIAAPSPSALAARLSGPAGLTATRNSFTRPEALRALAAAHQQGATRERLEAMVDGYLARPEVVSLLVDRGGRERFSTQDLLACEARILAHAEGGRGAGVGVLPAALVEGVIGARAARGRPLTAEQAEVVREVTRSGRRLDVVQALAGTGKTVVLGAIAECYARAGYLVVGAAPTARAARELAGAGVPARTLDGLVASLAARGGFPAGRPVLVLLDEAGAAGSRAWAALCAYTEAAGAKEVCAGDAGQLQSVPAGGAFRALAQAPEALSLRQVLRQREPQHRAALAALHDGDGASYLGFLLARGALHVAGREEAVAGAVGQWAEAQAELPWGQAALIARDNALRAELNAHARAEARVRGWVTGPGLRVELAGGEEREYRVGERVIARQNRRDLDTDNGDRGTVTEVDARRGQIAVLVDDGRRVRYPHEYLARGLVEHAYALTGHGAQGGTLEATPIVGRPQDHSREWTYTAASRERTLSGVWLIEEERERDPGHDLPEVPSPLADPILRLGRALERTEAEDLALEQWVAPGGWAPEWETEPSSGPRTATQGRPPRDPLLGRQARTHPEKPAPEPGPEPTPPHRDAIRSFRAGSVSGTTGTPRWTRVRRRSRAWLRARARARCRPGVTSPADATKSVLASSGRFPAWEVALPEEETGNDLERSRRANPIPEAKRRARGAVAPPLRR